MKIKGAKYVIIGEGTKSPTHKFKGKGKSWDEVKDFDNIGIIPPEPYVVYDFDTKKSAAIMLDIVNSLNLQCHVMETPRGYHFWFKSDKPFKNFVKHRLACGIFCDCRSYGKNGYLKIKSSGVMRKWIRESKKVEQLPNYLKPLSASGETFNYLGMIEGGRNQSFFEYILLMQNKGYMKEDIKDTLHIINDFVLDDPLPEFEMKTILRDESFKPEEEVKEEQLKTRGFKHSDFGDELIEKYKILTVNDSIYIYIDGYYQRDERVIEREMIKLYHNIKQKDRSEVMSYIKIQTHTRPETLKQDPYVINLKNIRLDIKSEDILDHDPNVIDFTRIPVKYDPLAECDELDALLERVFCGDQEVIDLFDEMLGYCLLGNNRYRKGFMFYGNGKNGKSTVLEMIKRFLGIYNCSSIELDKLATDKFKVAELENKLANIGDDINDKAIKETGMIKKLLTGNSVLVERKGQRPFELISSTKHMYSCNSIPRSYDKTDGWYSRFIYIPFKAKFDRDHKGYDPNIEDKVTTEEAMSHLLNRALEGFQRLYENGDFTNPSAVQEVLTQYKVDNSTTLSWLEDEDIKLDHILDTPTSELYSEFKQWCIESGIGSKTITGRKAFSKEIVTWFDLSNEKKRKTNGDRFFVKKS